jgi:PKD repeat protein
VIDGSFSVNAQSFVWDFGDASTSTEPKVSHVYSAPGTYTISLTINGTLTLTKKISILPYLPAPYEEGDPDYAGDFEVHPEHFAAYSPSGTTFSRGVSDKPGKDGTHSGSNAWVLGINDQLYQNNTRAELYTPMYDLTQPGLYELKFWSKYAVQNRNDGFQVEYSLDGGASWTQYIKDISFLVGEPKVSFRFVFRSDEADPAQGLAIDDFQVTKFDGELKTVVTVFTADYTGDQEVTLNWTTGLEYQAQKFYIERSFTGFGFTQVGQVNAKGVVSTFPHTYEAMDQSLRNVIYYRLRVVNENATLPYYYEFYSDTIIVRRGIEPDIVQNVLTNPFTDKIYVSFSSVINQPITARLFDVSGKLVREEVTTPHNIAYVMEDLALTQGLYVLSIQVGEGEIKSYKMFTLGY